MATKSKKYDLPAILRRLNHVGIALSRQGDYDELLETILAAAIDLANADAGTLYLVSPKDRLSFAILRNKSLNLHFGGNSQQPIVLAPVPLRSADGTLNIVNVAACAANLNKTLRIKDAYKNKKYDFSGTRQFDKQFGYRSRSFLTVPMAKQNGEIIGVLQLINSRRCKKKQCFSKFDQSIIESLASQALVILVQKELIKAQRNLFDSFIRLVATTIDEKSPHTGEHCRRVPVLTHMIASAVCKTTQGPMANFSMTKKELYALDVAAWLHDCGKLVVPEYIMDKRTKLETIFDRVHLIDTRFSVLGQELKIKSLCLALRRLGKNYADVLKNDKNYQTQLGKIKSDRATIWRCNIGQEKTPEKDIATIQRIARYRWTNVEGKKKAFLNADERENLAIHRGTLTKKERKIIQNHATVSIRMLKKLPYPSDLSEVPEIAGGHHECLDGSGYPNRLTREKMSIPARILAIADVFEALTSASRPYKAKLSTRQALVIMRKLKSDGKIDPDIFNVFIRAKVYQQYIDFIENNTVLDPLH